MTRAPHHSQTRIRRQGDCEHPYEPDEPSGYLAWHEWAEEKAKTHEQRRCPACGLWVIYVARSGAERPNPDPASGPLARPTDDTSRGRNDR